MTNLEEEQTHSVLAFFWREAGGCRVLQSTVFMARLPMWTKQSINIRILAPFKTFKRNESSGKMDTTDLQHPFIKPRKWIASADLLDHHENDYRSEMTVASQAASEVAEASLAVLASSACAYLRNLQSASHNKPPYPLMQARYFSLKPTGIVSFAPPLS